MVASETMSENNTKSYDTTEYLDPDQIQSLWQSKIRVILEPPNLESKNPNPNPNTKPNPNW